jgi:hypothetical protein
MIKVEASLDDIDKIIKSKSSVEEKVGEICKVFLKFLSTMRSNQLLTDSERVEIRKKIEENRKRK